MEKKTIAAAQEFMPEQLTKRVLFKKGESVLFVLNFMPEQKLPPHKHPGTAVFILVLEGEGTITVDGQETKVAKGDVVCCEGDEQFAYANTGSANASLYVMLSKIPDERYAQNV